MDNWIILCIMLALAFITTRTITTFIMTLLPEGVKICDLKIMSDLYLIIWIEMILGCMLFSVVFYVYMPDATSLYKIVLGLITFGLIECFTNIRMYSTLRTNLELLDITNDEKLEEFMETRKDKEK